MNTNRLTRIAVTSGAAVLCFGVAAPAVAHTGAGATGKDGSTVQQLPTPTLQQEQAWIDSFVAHRTAWLDHLSAVVGADNYLSDAQKTTMLDGIAKAKDALAALKSAVDAATSTDQVHQIVSQALATMPFPAWPYRALDHHRPGHRGAFAGKHAKHDKSAGQNATAATLTAARGNKPCGQYGAAGASPTDISVHTVALHKDNAPAYAGRHRYHTGGSGGFDHGWGHHGGGRGGWGR